MIRQSADRLAAATSAITCGIVLAYAVGKPLGIAVAVWASRRAQPAATARVARLQTCAAS